MLEAKIIVSSINTKNAEGIGQLVRWSVSASSSRSSAASLSRDEDNSSIEQSDLEYNFIVDNNN